MSDENTKKLDAQVKEYIEIIDRQLESYLEPRTPVQIWDSMRYSVLAAGKRIRPILVLESCKVLSGSYELAIPTACAIEMLHAQSLIHDDLPCMDNDDMRRGKPTNHKVFPEAISVLAGDALISLGMQTILNGGLGRIKNEILLKILEEYTIAAGAAGIIGGQVADIEAEGKDISGAELAFIHAHKTGALFRYAIRAGALIAYANDSTLDLMTHFADNLGLAFQIADDVLDEISTLEELGKTPGKDKIAKKATYVSLYGLGAAIAKTKELCDNCCNLLTKNNIDSPLLQKLVKDIAGRIERK